MEQPGRPDDEWRRPDDERDEDHIDGEPSLTRKQKIAILTFRLLLDREHPVQSIADIPEKHRRMLEAKERVKRKLREQGIEPDDLK